MKTRFNKLLISQGHGLPLNDKRTFTLVKQINWSNANFAGIFTKQDYLELNKRYELHRARSKDKTEVVETKEQKYTTLSNATEAELLNIKHKLMNSRKKVKL